MKGPFFGRMTVSRHALNGTLFLIGTNFARCHAFPRTGMWHFKAPIISNTFSSYQELPLQYQGRKAVKEKEKKSFKRQSIAKEPTER